MVSTVRASKSANKTMRRYMVRLRGDMRNAARQRAIRARTLAARALPSHNRFLPGAETLPVSGAGYDVHHRVRIVRFSRVARFDGVNPRITRFPLGLFRA
jgi:hypothetical protein